MKLSIVYKLAITSAILVFISVAVVGSLFYNTTTKLLVTQVLNDLSKDVKNAGYKLQQLVDTQKSDVLFLSITPPIQGMLDTKNQKNIRFEQSSYQQWNKRLDSIFRSQLLRKKSYLKIRYINKEGLELVSVKRRGLKVYSVKKNELQNKKNRPYVVNALKLSLNKVYVSEINLNREYGQVSVPHQKVLRISTPVFDMRTNKVAGLVVVTADIADKLADIQKKIAKSSAGKTIYITNDFGGYLLHPDDAKTFGFDLGHRYRIQEDLPNVAKLYLPEDKSTQLTLLPRDTHSQQVINFTKIRFDINNPKRFIGVIISQDFSDIVAQQRKLLSDVTVWSVLLVIMSTVIAVILSFRLTHPIKDMIKAVSGYSSDNKTAIELPINQGDEVGVLARAFCSMIDKVQKTQENLRKVNDSLEEMVDVRTRSLEESEARQSNILNTVNDAIITVDDKQQLSTFNPAAERIFGYKNHEVIGKHISLFLPEVVNNSYSKFYENSIAQDALNVSCFSEGQRKDGTIFPIELSISLLEENDSFGFVITIRDITERLKMDKMKDDFISTVSHELRTPLTSIRGSLGLIVGGVVGDIPREANNMLKLAESNTERLLLLINDILDIQKLESGELTMVPEKIAITSFMEKVIEANLAYAEQFSVRFLLKNTVPNAYIYADEHRMMKVMANLLSNAAKFSPEKAEVHIQLSQHKHWIRISVKDQGIGIPLAFHEKIFDKFTQSDTSDTKKKGGTGLGLNIAKAIVEKSGGVISFISEENIGTTFYIDMPEFIKL